MRKQDPLVERVLVIKLIGGDKEAFSTIFSAYYRDLVMFALSFTRERDTAEEIVQETFFKLWEDHESLKIDFSVKSYLLKSIQNRCIDLFRHKKIRQIHLEEVKNNSVLFEYNTDNYILRSELEDQIKKSLLLIPPDCAEAFRMNRNDGYKYQEIAEKLNVSVRTVENRISKALHLLQEHLKDYLN
ncbi:MAG: RNA polymerase sigma-70 factor [Bacteroidales bacterium]|nr:RNA polymerase sigma-70 factor [Bacteroidales bacterium]